MLNLLNNIQGWVQSGPMGNDLQIANAKVITGGLNEAGTTSHNVFVPEVWAPAVEVAFKDKLVFANYANDLSAFVSEGADKIHIPTFDTIATGDKTVESAISYGTDATAMTEETLTIDQHTYSATLIEDVLQVQSNYDLMNIYSQEMGYALANKIDEYLESKLLASCQSASGKINGIVTGADLKTASNADFELILNNVLSQDQDVSNWTLIVSPTAYAGLSALVQLSYGTASAPLGAGFGTTGQIATVFGMPIVMSANVTTATTNMDNAGGETDNFTPIGYCVHKTAMQIAYSQGVRMQADYDIDYLGTKMVADMVYGCNIRNSATTGQRRVFILGAE
tara:strand:- start:2090 stop:3103 length:1014 start_codon:yes stop_codon:yes gene_type:complete